MTKFEFLTTPRDAATLAPALKMLREEFPDYAFVTMPNGCQEESIYVQAGLTRMQLVPVSATLMGFLEGFAQGKNG